MKEKIQKEIDRVKELLVFYEEIPTGGFGAAMIKASIKNAESVLEAGNYTEHSAKECLKDLESITG
jgi:hypothetical protein